MNVKLAMVAVLAATFSGSAPVKGDTYSIDVTESNFYCLITGPCEGGPAIRLEG